MRGEPKQQETMLSLVTPAKRVPVEHPIRRIKDLADAELVRLSPVFDEMYSGKGRPSIPPERLLKAQLLASLKSFRRKDGSEQKPPDDAGNPSVDFHGEKRSNETHQSTTDPDAKLYRKGNSQPAKLYFSGHALMENRNGLWVDFAVAQADGYAERAQALAMLDRQKGNGIRPRTLGADKAYDTREFIAELRARGITPHVARNQNKRRSAIDGRTVRHPGYALSQRCRKKVEEIFGWGKVIGGLRKTRFRGVQRTGLWGHLSLAAYNLLRLAKLLPRPAPA